MAHSSGTRSRVFSFSALKKAPMASSSRAVRLALSKRWSAAPNRSGPPPSRVARVTGIWIQRFSEVRPPPPPVAPGLGGGPRGCTRSRVHSFSASRQAATASSRRPVPLSRSPSAERITQVVLDHCPIERHESRELPKRFTKSSDCPSNGTVPLSRSPSRTSALPRLFWVTAQSFGMRSRVHSFRTLRNAATAASNWLVPLHARRGSKTRGRNCSELSPIEWRVIPVPLLQRLNIGGDRTFNCAAPLHAAQGPKAHCRDRSGAADCRGTRSRGIRCNNQWYRSIAESKASLSPNSSPCRYSVLASFCKVAEFACPHDRSLRKTVQLHWRNTLRLRRTATERVKDPRSADVSAASTARRSKPRLCSIYRVRIEAPSHWCGRS